MEELVKTKGNDPNNETSLHCLKGHEMIQQVGDYEFTFHERPFKFSDVVMIICEECELTYLPSELYETYVNDIFFEIFPERKMLEGIS